MLERHFFFGTRLPRKRGVFPIFVGICFSNRSSAAVKGVDGLTMNDGVVWKGISRKVDQLQARVFEKEEQVRWADAEWTLVAQLVCRVEFLENKLAVRSSDEEESREQHKQESKPGVGGREATSGLGINPVRSQASPKLMTVYHPKLWETLRNLGLPDELLRLLISFYTGMQDQWRRLMGCVGDARVVPPLLFMLFLDEEQRVCKLPALFYADNIVLVGGNTQELQTTRSTSCPAWHIAEDMLQCQKVATMSCHSTEDTKGPPLLLQGDLVQWTTRYKYFGVTISNESHYSAAYEEDLWGLPQVTHPVSRALCKAVVVPVLTFRNTDLCLSLSTCHALETRQQEAGRAALGVHGFVPNGAVQGDMGWSSFEVHEAVAKLAFEKRLSQTSDGRWLMPGDRTRATEASGAGEAGSEHLQRQQGGHRGGAQARSGVLHTCS
ncbi:hypothetical protein HPB48_004094 [Haemaphysalis longicornis]|uniref:Uncharacterized protein n=1 Tax=Haemaphysalis longicornis TaxID=44386 RepID=A0A9J6FM24_HAELO|nr:hypothetical protein HPB48_004094 [Haemaphysalis longicornis]